MSDSTTHLDQLTDQQQGKAATVNALFDAASPALTFGRRATSTGLTWAYFGGKLMVDEAITSIANGTVSLTSGSTNYVEATRAGVVSANTTGFTPGSIPLYEVVTGASSVTSYTDKRTGVFEADAHLVIAMGSPQQITLTAEQALARIIQVTGTSGGELVVPSVSRLFTIINDTGGALSVVNVGSPQASVSIATTKTAIVRSSVSGVFRVTADA